uniref:Uncharacterized protein n=1 Tax=Anguilla anguilla TaxID=7936 RepID=A0A0E9QJ23_ANGAN
MRMPQNNISGLLGIHLNCLYGAHINVGFIFSFHEK